MIIAVNSAAGSAESDRLQRAVEILQAGAGAELVVTASPDDLGRAAERAAGSRLVIAGGDGSLHLAVSCLRALGLLDEVVLGLVPLGTGNDFARGLHVPLEPDEAARLCLEGAPRPLDLLVSDAGDVVVNAVHAGLGAAAAKRSDGLKESLGSLAYPIGAIIAGVSEAGYELDVTVDGEPLHSGSTLMVGVANGPCIGGGTALCASAVPDDGLLDVVVVSAVSRAARTAFAAALRNGVHLDREDVIHVRGRSVTIAGDEVAHDADGEILGPFPRRSYRVEPGAWRMLAPAGAAGAPRRDVPQLGAAADG